MKKDINVEDFPVLCCFCLVKSKKLKLISEVSSVNLFTKITGINFSDSLPVNLPEDKHDALDSTILCLKSEDLFCNHCKIKFMTKDSWDAHLKNCVLQFNCVDCNKVFNEETELLQHSKNNCKNKFELVINVKNIISYENSKSDYIDCSVFLCDNCKSSFKNKSDLDKHFKENSQCLPSSYNCVECKKSFSKKHKLVSHMRSHTKEEPFQCKECGKGFRFQQNLKRHMLIHKGVKPFTCDVCGKAFSRAHVRNEHMNTHTGHNPYICMYCGKGFKRYANHFIHVYRHKLINGEIDKSKDRKLYLQLECDECNKIFANRGALANHMLLHQVPVEKKFLCNECGKGFLTKAHLKSHSRTHTGECPYQCKKCGKSYKQKSSYTSHQLTHSGERPYRCIVCAKLFTQSGHLKVHMRVHSGEKPFVCNFCNKSFSLKSNLKVHTRIHTGETPYMCALCGQGYYDSTSLKKHMKSHHGGTSANHGYLEEYEVDNGEGSNSVIVDQDGISIENKL
ncbi:hypothetical protein GWI33_019825 [Rhynchophorus ferrugineus]|uniref:C2H2-type domain-containing protein n=1 Tax=Rhynchophorus ferrugineus TaxID=354439 RepID=A0A834M3X1_RHYFE|nr:hypothetical protein GWI33_019825 [Rhynchophorus ferrugineus]